MYSRVPQICDILVACCKNRNNVKILNVFVRLSVFVCFYYYFLNFLDDMIKNINFAHLLE